MRGLVPPRPNDRAWEGGSISGPVSLSMKSLSIQSPRSIREIEAGKET